jgi:hypothetical protein
MKRKHSKPPAAPQEGLPNPTARVSITEVAPNADQLLEQLRKDPAQIPGTVRQLIKHAARLIEVAPLIQKGKKRAETEAKTLGKAREDSKRDADARKQAAVVIAERWLRKDPRLRLPRQTSELARKVCSELPTLPKRLSSNTVRHWLAKWLKTVAKK